MSSRSESDIEDSRLPENLFLQKDVKKLLTSTNNAFTENWGQLDNDEVRFYVQGGGVWFTDDGVWFELREYAENRCQESGSRSQGDSNPLEGFEPPEPTKYKRVVLKQEFVGANPVTPEGRGRLSWNSNFFYGNDSSKWCTDVPNYREVYYENLYDGIDLRYYTNENGLKYDLIVYPYAEISQIKIKYEGAEELKINNMGNLVIKTQVKELVDGELFIYQDSSQSRYPIKGKFILYDKNEYGFELLENYQKQKILVIDPKLDYSTYIGGNGEDSSRCMSVDSAGNAFITGWTKSSDFPNTTGANDTSYNGGERDIFIFKLDPNGSALIYSTFIGGKASDDGVDIAVDSNGNSFVTGQTSSQDFPITLGAFDDSLSATTDVFVLKLSTNGSKLIYSTYIGGSGAGHEFGDGIAVDNLGNAYITGPTNSMDFPITSDAYDIDYNGNSDGFIIKLNQTGSDLIYSTYIGGDDGDWSRDIAIDSIGNAYVTGHTDSLNFPSTNGSFDRYYNGFRDGFILKLNRTGSGVIYSTFIGGNHIDIPLSIAVDSSGFAFVSGSTWSSNFPITPETYDTSHNGYHDNFVLKLDYNGSALIYSTFVGGNQHETQRDMVIDLNGNVFVTGHTYSANFPTTSDAHDLSYNGGLDGYLFELDWNGSNLLYSTYLGGNNLDIMWGIGMDYLNSIYLTGFTNSSDFIKTPGTYQSPYDQQGSVFVQKFIFTSIINITSISLLKNNIPVNKIYSQLCPYTFRAHVIDLPALTELSKIRLTLDPLRTNIQLLWDRRTGTFSKIFDPNDYVTLEPSSKAYNNSRYIWTIDFNVTFNWTYPNEELQDVQVYATNDTILPAWLNATNMYSVENDLVFKGTLLVFGEDNQSIDNSELVRGGEMLNWTGLTPVYENTTDVYPDAAEFDVSLWSESYNSWSDSPAAGENFTFQTVTTLTTDLEGDTHTINITGIPPECDATNTTFTIRIDGEDIVFYNPIPNNSTWETKSSFVTAGITITDFGGAEVKGSSVKFCSSIDNGSTWSDWDNILGLQSSVTVNPEAIILFEEGTNNLIKWKAEDTVGNGPVESEGYRILLDLKDVKFSNPYPLPEYESPKEEVEVGITISDLISGVNASSIEYAISHDSGKNWYSWMPISGLKDGNEINVTINLTFPNGTSNRIKWRASDIAGNGPKESSVYPIKVNTWLEEISKPRVKLWNPPNSSIIPITSVELSWRLENSDLRNITYDVYLDTIDPPSKLNQSDIINTSLILDNLINGVTYYWTVIPKNGTINGSCLSGVWTFTIAIPVPSVALVFPDNASIVQTVRPSLSWLANYDGTEKLTYDIYLDTNPSPNIWQRNIPNAYYIPKSNLEDNITYYWKIIPWAGEVRGIDSEIWSFTVKKYFLPRFDIQLVLEPSMIELKPSQMATVNAIVTNQGELTDTVSVSIEIPSDAEVGAIVNEPSTLDIISNGTKQFVLTVTTTEDIKKGEVILIVIATSEDAMEHDLVVEEKAELTVKILELDKHEPNKISSLFTFLNILFIVIVIIIILAIAIFVIKRKKREEEEPKPEEAVMVKPGEVTTPVLSIGEKPPLPQLSETTIKSSDTSQITTTTISTPQLPGTVSATVTPDSQQPPQLPPGQPQTLEIEANVTATVFKEKTQDPPITQNINKN